MSVIGSRLVRGTHWKVGVIACICIHLGLHPLCEPLPNVISGE